jgi:hypothetical protein
MTNEEIYAKLLADDSFEKRVHLVDDRPYIVVEAGFDPETEEAHDGTWRCLLETQEALKELGLTMPSPETDNDSVFGHVAEIKS